MSENGDFAAAAGVLSQSMDDNDTLDERVLDRARLSRDPRFDGKFFIAVTSTGVYCRPICPVRSPKKTNIRYFATAAAAVAAGFRPCLRCRPEAAPGTPAWFGTSAVVGRALRLIEAGELDVRSVDQLAARVGIGPRHLNRLFMEHVGASPIAVAQTRRLNFAKRLLDETSLPITQIASAAGFGSVRRFNSAFKHTNHRSPRELRKQLKRGLARGTDDEVVLRLAFRPPYDWNHMRDFLAARAVPGVERVDARGYARTLRAEHGELIVCVRPLEAEHVLELRVHGARPEMLLSLSATARRVFDLSADPATIAAAFCADSLLAPLVRRRPGLRIPGMWEPFECAVRAVLGQQVSVAAARTLAARLVARAGEPVAESVDGLTHLFPSPATLVSANLDGLGLTGARIGAIRALARAVTDGAIDFCAPAEEVTASLAALPGFGRWTAEYVALRALGEPDAFPTADLVLRRVAGNGDRPLTERMLAARAEPWRPWRSYAVLHLWQAATAGRVNGGSRL